LFLVVLASQTTAAPGNLFPDEQAELVAAVEHSAGLLIVAQPDEVCPHLLDQLHLGANQLFAHRRTEQGVVLVAMRSLDQKSRAIESERTVVDKFKRAQSKALGDIHLTMGAGKSNLASIEDRMRRGPQLR